jgi:hypothetical protein
MFDYEYCGFCQNTHWAFGGFGYTLRYGCNRNLKTWRNDE